MIRVLEWDLGLSGRPRLLELPVAGDNSTGINNQTFYDSFCIVYTDEKICKQF